MKFKPDATAFNGDKIALALSLLPEAAKLAVVPVSQFHVGAIAIDSEGNFYFGANQECATASMGQTVHAEQSAVSHAWQRGATRITDIVVNYTPCGHCRQFLNELPDAGSLKIHLPHSRDNTLASLSARQLFAQRFKHPRPPAHPRATRHQAA